MANMNASELIQARYEAEKINRQMEFMTPEDRLVMMQTVCEGWCRYCGGEGPCQCWNDE